MLLKVYKDQNISGWVVSEKLDGIRGYWDGKKLISRGSKIIHASK
jgi:DNA ligase-1